MNESVRCRLSRLEQGIVAKAAEESRRCRACGACWPGSVVLTGPTARELSPVCVRCGGPMPRPAGVVKVYIGVSPTDL